jgi:hypothetical protein
MEEIVHRTVTADNYESMTLKDVREQLQQELGWSDEQWKEHKDKVKQAVTERVQELGEPAKSKKLKRKSKGDEEVEKSPKKKPVQKKEKKEKKEKAKKKPVRKAKSTAAKRSPYYKKLTELAGAKKIK